jgi:hypothetical protein
MQISRSRIIIPGLFLAILVVVMHPALGRAGTTTFTGKIQDIGKATELDVGQHEKYYVLKLDSQPQAEFRLTPEEAVRSGVIDTAGLSQVVTPRHKKGLGWRVRLTCDSNPEGTRKAPIYKVKYLERY